MCRVTYITYCSSSSCKPFNLFPQQLKSFTYRASSSLSLPSRSLFRLVPNAPILPTKLPEPNEPQFGGEMLMPKLLVPRYDPAPCADDPRANAVNPMLGPYDEGWNPA